MKRRTIINRLKGLTELSALTRSYFTGNIGEWVGLGLLTEAEYEEYKAGWDAEGKLSQALRDAEDAVPRPDFQTNPRFPKAYLDLVARFQELRPLVEDERAVRNVLGVLRDRGYMSSQSIGDRLGLRDLAGRAQESIKDAEDDFDAEYWKLKEAIERRERVGTIVARIRHELAGELDAAKKEARTNAEARIMSKYRGIIERKRELERLIEKRRTEKLQPIREAMAKLIREALPKGVEVK